MKTTQSNNLTNTNLQSQTMYNLHTKRTLPRDVIKWMQGLDLSYSVKDYRKDMNNGFLIGEIISRYQPGRIPMHSFQNSSNQARRDNNWSQLELFFSKFTLRNVQISQDQYSKIKTNQDPKFQQLYNFICHLYSICTKRAIQQSPPAVDLPPTQNPNLTHSYLLKDDGLEKLDNGTNQQQNNNNNISHSQMLKNSGLSEKIQDRIPTRKIATNIQSGDLVDPTGVGIRSQGRKMTSKRKSWGTNNFNQQNKDFITDDQQKQEPDRLIFDYMSEIMQQCLSTNYQSNNNNNNNIDTTAIREILFPQDNNQFTATELFARNLSILDQQFVIQYLTQLNLCVDQLTVILLREINQTWKFFTYLFKLFRYINDNNNNSSQVFNILCDVIGSYARNCHAKQPKRLGKVFYQALLITLVNEVKLVTSNMRRKQSIMGLLYDFTGRTLQQKKTALSKLKDLISSSNILYIQWLSVLVNQQLPQTNTNSNNNPHTTQNNKPLSQLLDDYIYYAQQFISSPIILARTSALKIMLEISKSECQLVEKYFMSKSQQLTHSRNDPQQVCLLVQIYYCLLKSLIQSPTYQSLIKGVGSTNLVKAYNPDNQRVLQQVKTKLNTISQTIKTLSESTANEIIRELSAKLSIPYITESQHMMNVFLDYIYSISAENKLLFFNNNTEQQLQQQQQFTFKSTTITLPVITIQQIKDHSNEILSSIISLKTNKSYQIEQFMWLINHCLENINVKKINMEFWEDVAIHIVKVYTKLLTIEEYSQLAGQGLVRIFKIQFAYDMKIRELPQWIIQSINTYIQEVNAPPKSAQKQQKQAVINQQVTVLNDWLNAEYQRTKNQMLAFVINQINTGLVSENKSEPNKKLIKLKKL